MAESIKRSCRGADYNLETGLDFKIESVAKWRSNMQ